MPGVGASIRVQLGLVLAIAGLLAAVACARNPSLPEGTDPRMQVEPDSIRGRHFAELIIPGDTSVAFGIDLFPVVPRVSDFLQRGPAFVLVAVIVDSVGRVEAASRTVLGSVGDARVMRVVCDYLATATLDWRGRAQRRTAVIIPGIFFSGTAARGDMPRMPTPPALLGDTPFNPNILVPRLRALSLEQRQQWFADQQPCASFQAK